MVAELDAPGIDRAIVGGVSMGGYVALAVLRSSSGTGGRAGAGRHPQRCRRCRRAGAAPGGRGTGRRGDIAAGPDAIAPLIADGTAGAVREELARIAADVPPASVAWAQRAMAARPDSTAVLAAAGVPVLIVVGERDAVTPPAAAQDMARVAPDVELVELPGVGHLTPAEDPAGLRRRRSPDG